MGSISPQGGIKVADIGVATIEKANGIVNRLELFYLITRTGFIEQKTKVW